MAMVWLALRVYFKANVMEERGEAKGDGGRSEQCGNRCMWTLFFSAPMPLAVAALERIYFHAPVSKQSNIAYC